MTFTYALDAASNDVEPIHVIRLLLNDVDEGTAVFSDQELEQFLFLEGGAVKLAAAQAIDTNATNEVLASKVLRTQDLQVDGAKVATALYAHADRLRVQHFDALEGEDEGYFGVVEAPSRWPEVAERPRYF